jgi:hypothetical protein
MKQVRPLQTQENLFLAAHGNKNELGSGTTPSLAAASGLAH